MVSTSPVSSRGTTRVDASARGEDFYLAIRGDFFLATSGDRDLATRGDFFMATDNSPGAGDRTPPTYRAHGPLGRRRTPQAPGGGERPTG